MEEMALWYVLLVMIVVARMNLRGQKRTLERNERVCFGDLRRRIHAVGVTQKE